MPNTSATSQPTAVIVAGPYRDTAVDNSITVGSRRVDPAARRPGEGGGG